VGGALFVVAPKNTAGGGLRLTSMPCTHVRLKVTGNAGATPTNDILDFTIDAVVIPDVMTEQVAQG